MLAKSIIEIVGCDHLVLLAEHDLVSTLDPSGLVRLVALTFRINQYILFIVAIRFEDITGSTRRLTSLDV